MAESIMTDRIKHVIANDRLIPLFGMEVEEASESGAQVSAVVKDEFLQVHGLAHGAFIFALLDVAFALTVNATVDAVGVQWSISQFRSASAGDKVTAECRLLHGGRRLMVVELVVSGAGGKLLAKGQATAIPVGGERSGH
ncbi:MAG: PaaI family thioesterase [bacterium]